MNITPEYTMHFMSDLADKADSIARRYFKKTYQVQTKADKTAVTAADKEIEQTLRQSIKDVHPSHGIMGEEFGSEKMDAEYIWVIDPIDGTKAFIKGEPTFTTLIGLLKNGKPYAGMVSQAIERKRWCAVASAPAAHVIPAKAGIQRAESSAQKDTSSLHPPPEIPAYAGMTKDKMQGDLLKIATTSWDYMTEKQRRRLKTMELQGHQITYGGDAYAYMMLAEGKLDAVFDVALKPHDILPLLPILKNAGVYLSFFDANGVSDEPTGNIVAAKTSQVTDKIIKMFM